MASLSKEAYNRALYDHNHDETSYELQERLRSYVIGTDHQLRSDSEIVRDNLYGSFTPKGRDAFSKPDTLMDEEFSCEPVKLNDAVDVRNFKPFAAPDFPHNKVINYVTNAYYTLPYDKKKICLDNIILLHRTWTDPLGHVLHICEAVMGVNGYIIWEAYSWEL